MCVCVCVYVCVCAGGGLEQAVAGKLRAKIKEVEDRSVESECMVAFLKEQVLSLELLVYGALSY